MLLEDFNGLLLNLFLLPLIESAEEAQLFIVKIIVLTNLLNKHRTILEFYIDRTFK